MRRIISVLAVSVLMAAMMVASASAAFAVANENANCVGETRSNQATVLGSEMGPFISEFSKNNQGLGQELSPDAKSNCGAG